MEQIEARARGPGAARCGCGLLTQQQLSDRVRGCSSLRGPALQCGFGTHSWKFNRESFFSPPSWCMIHLYLLINPFRLHWMEWIPSSTTRSRRAYSELTTPNITVMVEPRPEPSEKTVFAKVLARRRHQTPYHLASSNSRVSQDIQHIPPAHLPSQ